MSPSVLVMARRRAASGPRGRPWQREGGSYNRQRLNRPNGMPPPRNASASGPSPAPLEFRPIRASRAFEEIAAQIRSELAQGRLRVGSRLPSERALAEQFGVSRNTLREALRSLEHAGLIRLQKGATGGAFITEGSSDAIGTGLLDMYHLGAIRPAQLTEARIWLEEIIVREACRRATAPDCDALEANVQAAGDAAKAGEFEKSVALHLEFHRMLARLTGNPIMVTVMDGVLGVLTHFIGQIGEQTNPYVLPSRRRLLKHLRERDSDAAVAEMSGYLRKLQTAYLSQAERGVG
jgi:GntR family transcriptional regulator, transcriptional repressor for pyruvate dehydrogenase complex